LVRKGLKSDGIVTITPYRFPMHHVQFQPGQAVAAADYQAHLDRMRAIAQARHEAEVSRRTRDKALPGYVDADQESPDQGGSSAGEEEASEGEPEAADDGQAGGTRYA